MLMRCLKLKACLKKPSSTYPFVSVLSLFLLAGCSGEETVGKCPANTSLNRAAETTRIIDYYLITTINTKQIAIYKKTSSSALEFQRGAQFDLKGTPVDFAQIKTSDSALSIGVLTSNPNKFILLTYKDSKFERTAEYDLTFIPEKLIYDGSRYWIAYSNLKNLLPFPSQGAPTPALDLVVNVRALALNSSGSFYGLLSDEPRIALFEYSGNIRTKFDPLVSGTVKLFGYGLTTPSSSEGAAMAMTYQVSSSSSPEIAFGFSRDGQTFSETIKYFISGEPQSIAREGETFYLTTKNSNTLEQLTLSPTTQAFKRQLTPNKISIDFNPGRISVNELGVLIESPASRQLLRLSKPSFQETKVLDLPDNISGLESGLLSETITESSNAAEDCSQE